jgi:hypothetical protein
MTERAEHILAEIRSLPRTEQLQLVEHVIHDLAAVGTPPSGASVIGLFADEPELIDEVERAATEARERDPLRRPGG